ncbi:MAG: hypothetical protein R3E39_16080 [Anaerolineae bacterium]
MSIFDASWIKQLEDRYRNHANYEKPAIYYYATDPHYELVRIEIEYWISQLPKEAIAKITPRLHAEKHFEQTYNELVISNILVQCGYAVEYEKTFSVNYNKLTPDWFITGNGLEVVLEAVTINPPPISIRERRRLGYLYARLGLIKSNAIVELDYDDRFSPDQQRSSEIVKALQNWLNNNYLQQGAKLDLSDVAFELRDWGNHVHLKYQSPATAFSLNLLENLKKTIQAKVDKYKILGKPLLVGIVPNFHTFLDIDDIKNALWGEEAWPIDWNNLNSENIMPIRKRNGLFTSPKSISSKLSAIIWVPKRLGIELPMPMIGIFPNPKAELAVNQNHFRNVYR